MKIPNGLADRFSLFAELLLFIVVRKKWWLAPLFIVFTVMVLVLVIAEIPAVAPFIYALF